MAKCGIIQNGFLRKGECFRLMKKLKKNPVFSYAVIIIAYALAIYVGIVIAKAMTASAWVGILVADIVATVIIFIFSTIFKNASIYDPYWSVAPIVIVAALAFSTELSFFRFLLIFALVIWGGRLTFNWASRFKNLRGEDWRYKRFRKLSGPMFPIINFTGIHLFPTVIVYLCMLPVIIAFSEDAPFSVLSLVFILIALGAVFIEGYADYHMNLFRKDVADGYATGCCRYGLWKNCRHPNYLGEMTFWWAIYFSVVCALPSKWYLFFGALANTIMFLVVSIPMAEARLETKPGYPRYKKQTHLLLPFKKKNY